MNGLRLECLSCQNETQAKDCDNTWMTYRCSSWFEGHEYEQRDTSLNQPCPCENSRYYQRAVPDGLLIVWGEVKL